MKVAPEDKTNSHALEIDHPSSSSRSPTADSNRSEFECPSTKRMPKRAWSHASWSHLKVRIDEWKAKRKFSYETLVYRTPSIYRFISIIGFFIFYVGVVGNFMYISPKIRLRVRKELRLKQGAAMRKTWEESPIPIPFMIYLFNVTNPDEVDVGGKPNLEEVGPYTFYKFQYRLYQTEIRDKNDSVEYTMFEKYLYQPQLNPHLNGNESITVLHPIFTIIGLALKIDKEREQMLPLIAQGLDSLFDNPRTIFWSGRAMDFMFDGIFINCSKREFHARLVCSYLDQNPINKLTSQEGNQDLYKFSFFHNINNTANGRWKINRGIRDLRKRGQLISYNGNSSLDLWSGPSCNMIRGTDTYYFEGMRKPNMSLWVHEFSFCRSVEWTLVETTRIMDLDVQHYTWNVDEIANNQKLRCYCRDNTHCPARGSIDLYPCYKFPIAATKPHFLDVDEHISKHVNGLKPNSSLHAVDLYLEVVTGLPLISYKRLQYNYEIFPVPEMKQLKNLRQMLFPILWINEGFGLNKTLALQIKKKYIRKMNLISIIYAIGFTIGPVLWLIFFFIYLACRERPACKQLSASDNDKWAVWSAKSREEYW